jgi:hypothetical protein
MEKGKNTCPTFAKVIAACEHNGIKDIMQRKYDWNANVIDSPVLLHPLLRCA